MLSRIGSWIRAVARVALVLVAALFGAARSVQRRAQIESAPDARMPPPFGPRSNRIARVMVVAAIAGLVAVPLFLMGWVRTPAVTGQYRVVPQPVWFDHRHHVAGYQIDCRYCHYFADRARYAGVPPTATCVPCHNAQWLASPYFEPVRASLATGAPIPWQRVHDLPDFVIFDHASHVNNGVGCETCHGRVDEMRLVHQVEPLTMQWCLDCHMEPERYLRPASEITTMGWEPDRPQRELGAELRLAYGVREITTCTACHY